MTTPGGAGVTRRAELIEIPLFNQLGPGASKNESAVVSPTHGGRNEI
jgi:hypothetical protein